MLEHNGSFNTIQGRIYRAEFFKQAYYTVISLALSHILGLAFAQSNHNNIYFG